MKNSQSSSTSNIETLSEKLSVPEQRELLLTLNPDLLYGVYQQSENTDETIDIQLSCPQNILTAYTNQLPNIQGLDKAPDISLIDLGGLRKGACQTLAGKPVDCPNAVLLSNGVVEYIEGASGKPHLITTLRDGGSFDQVQYTTTAGRNVGENLKEEIEREHFEEGPFLGTNAQGEYVLAIPANEQTDSYLLEDTVWNTYNDLLQSISDKKRQEAYTVSSVIWWLENKYTLKRENEQDARFIRAFERHFPGIKYEELGDILRDIVDNKRFVRYGWDRKPIEGLENDMKTIAIANNGQREVPGGYVADGFEFSRMKAYVFVDEANNTIEYRDVRRITGLPEGFQLIGNRPSKLFLESQNQAPRMPRIENAGKQAVPTIKKIAESVREALEKKKKEPVQNTFQKDA